MAGAWCAEMGADAVSDLEGFEDEFAAALGELKVIKRTKLLRRLSQLIAPAPAAAPAAAAPAAADAAPDAAAAPAAAVPVGPPPDLSFRVASLDREGARAPRALRRAAALRVRVTVAGVEDRWSSPVAVGSGGAALSFDWSASVAAAAGGALEAALRAVVGGGGARRRTTRPAWCGLRSARSMRRVGRRRRRRRRRAARPTPAAATRRRVPRWARRRRACARCSTAAPIWRKRGSS